MEKSLKALRVFKELRLKGIITEIRESGFEYMNENGTFFCRYDEVNGI